SGRGGGEGGRRFTGKGRCAQVFEPSAQGLSRRPLAAPAEPRIPGRGDSGDLEGSLLGQEEEDELSARGAALLAGFDPEPEPVPRIVVDGGGARVRPAAE